MSSKRMSLLPRATLLSDSEQEQFWILSNIHEMFVIHYSRVYVQYITTGELNLPWMFTTGEFFLQVWNRKSPGILPTWETRLHREFITQDQISLVCWSFRNYFDPVVSFYKFLRACHNTTSQGQSFTDRTLTYFNYRRTCDSCWKKVLYLRNSNRLFGGQYPKELFSNTSNSTLKREKLSLRTFFIVKTVSRRVFVKN